MRKLTTNEYIEKVKLKHNNKYDYSKVNYKTSHDKIIIICKSCGREFLQTANSHMNGNGCNYCSSTGIKDTDWFIESAKKIHYNKYDYSFSEYNGAHSQVKIICKKHGLFLQSASWHLRGKGCRKCSNEKTSYGLKVFIKNAEKIHRDKYDYSKSVYVNANTPLKIICKIHGVFEQKPYNHINLKCGCPQCKSSKGENEIFNFLKNNNIKFETQKKFKDCKDKRSLPFDFYLPEKNMCIEFDGEQHFSDRYNFSNGRGSLDKTQRRDEIKNKFCKTNDINLIRIPYFEINNIDKILSEKIL